MPLTPNSRLRLLLADAGWTGTQLAQATRRVAGEHGRQLACDRSSVSRWLAGAQPRPPAPAYLLEALSRRLGRRVTAQQAGLTRAPLPAPALDWEGAAPLTALTRLTETELDPARRALLGAEPFSPLAFAVPEPLPRPRPPRTVSGMPDGPAESGDRRAGELDAERMEAMAGVFAAAADRFGGGPVRAALAAYLAREVTARLHAPAPERVHGRLLGKTAQLTLLLGRICADGGDDAVAQRYHGIAVRLAADAGDHATIAIALRAMATHAHDLGHTGTRVLQLADRACDHARYAPPVVQTYAQAQLAVTLAHHDRRAALTALTRAERLYSAAGPASAGPFGTYSLGALHYQRAQTLGALGDHAGSVGALTASLRARGPGESHARALTHARLAETRLRLGHLDAALPHWRAFLDDYAALDSVRAARRLTAMRRALQPHRHYPAAAPLLIRAEAAG
ncbi:hypothetical protein [Streptomyces sp. CAU 1734]|uniref:hypothetical protein n=1 Tax=Streptomyces sp. CAU 1734 TaxID=3140360 RepID=UPI00326076B0